MDQELRVVTIIHLALCFGVAMFFGVIFILIQDEIVFTINTEEIFIYVVPFVAVSMVSVGQAIGRKHINEIKPELSLREKIAAYRTALIIKMSTIEAPALFSIVAFSLTQEAIYGAIAIVLWALMLFHKPSRKKIILDLSLSPDEIEEIRLKKNFNSDKT